jgi:hypothetical protein
VEFTELGDVKTTAIAALKGMNITKLEFIRLNMITYSKNSYKN